MIYREVCTQDSLVMNGEGIYTTMSPGIGTRQSCLKHYKTPKIRFDLEAVVDLCLGS